MTRPAALVLDGNQIKIRLEADRKEYGAPVHVDWLRFTLPRRAAPLPSAEFLFPAHSDSYWGERAARLSAILGNLPDCEVSGASSHAFKPDEKGAALEALQVAEDMAVMLGEGFAVALEVRKGHDFYKFRWSIMRGDAEAGWVGFLSSSSSPRQQAQGKTIHVNLYGLACTFGAIGWREKAADYIDRHAGDITRCDLALDFFHGLPGGLDQVVNDYKAGLCNVNGKEPKCNMLGDWVHGHGRSFYFGSKEAGKQTNVYEKGDQLFGVEAGSTWHRIELRYGNKLRVLPSDMLRNPSDYFAGASDWHAAQVLHASHQVSAEKVRCKKRLEQQTVEAEAARSFRWLLNVAVPSVSAWLQHGTDQVVELFRSPQLPGRLSKFTHAELREAMALVLPNAQDPGQVYACA